MKSARGIYDYDVIAVLFGVFHGFRRDFNGVTLTFFENIRACFFTDDFKLIYRCGTIHVACGEKGFFVLLFEI